MQLNRRSEPSDIHHIEACGSLWSSHKNTQYTQGIPQSLWALASSDPTKPDIRERERIHVCTCMNVYFAVVGGQSNAKQCAKSDNNFEASSIGKKYKSIEIKKKKKSKMKILLSI